jgi:endonuclease/exonuclease/phosphatase family metal-dependent hydrolase
MTACGRPGRVRLRVATFNIHHGVGAYGRLDLARTADVVAATGATVVGLQEVDRALSRRSDWVDQAAWLGERLGMEVVHGATIDRVADPAVPDGPRRRYGNALLSAHPVLAWRAVALPGSPRREPRGLVDARVDVAGTAVRVVVTHLQVRSRRERLEQAAHIVDMVGGDDDGSAPTVLLGDMNAGPDSPEMRVLTAVLADVWASVGDGPGHTFVAPRPFARIDHVLVSAPLTPVSAEVVDTRASDHLPVVADVDLSSARDRRSAGRR